MKCIKDLELQTITKPEDIDPPLGSYIDGFFEGIFGGARTCFEHDQKVMPYVFTLKDRKITPCMIKELTPDTKPSLFRWIQKQVSSHDACIFVNEVWAATMLESEKKLSDILLAPSQRADHEEYAMVNLWVHTRRITLMAEITRNPDQLGPWKLLDDTESTRKDMPHGVGPMVGVPYPEEKTS
jgi:hypothetical protein